MYLRNYEFKSAFARKYEQQGVRKALSKQIEHKFGALTDRDRDRIAVASPETLQLWLRQVLSATDIQAVFAEPQ